MEQLFTDQLLSLVDSDPYGFVYQVEGEISEKNLILRDERWKSIESMVLQEPDIYERDKRGKLVRFSVENTGKNKRLFYKYMAQYWQRGKVKNALLPDYKNSGGRGKEKTFTDQKNGRRRKFETIIGEGVIVTDEIKRTFEVSVKRFFYTAKKNPLATIYELMLKTFFVADYRYENGVKNQYSFPRIKSRHLDSSNIGMKRPINLKGKFVNERETENMD